MGPEELLALLTIIAFPLLVCGGILVIGAVIVYGIFATSSWIKRDFQTLAQRMGCSSLGYHLEGEYRGHPIELRMTSLRLIWKVGLGAKTPLYFCLYPTRRLKWGPRWRPVISLKPSMRAGVETIPLSSSHFNERFAVAAFPAQAGLVQRVFTSAIQDRLVEVCEPFRPRSMGIDSLKCEEGELVCVRRGDYRWAGVDFAQAIFDVLIDLAGEIESVS
jgi:hypothetical protein